MGYLEKNQQVFGSIGASGYVRGANDHYDGSIHMQGTTTCQNGDEITIRTEQGTDVTTSASMIAGGNIVVTRLDEDYIEVYNTNSVDNINTEEFTTVPFGPQAASVASQDFDITENGILCNFDGPIFGNGHCSLHQHW